MKQVLILALGCSVYKKNPLIRVEIDDVFVDEFDLPHTINHEEIQKNYNQNDPNIILQPDPYPMLKEYQQFLLEKSYLKIYEIENKNVLDVHFSFYNDDNNYTNGFMNKATFVYPIFFNIVPYKVFKNVDIFVESYKYNRKYFKKAQEIKSCYMRDKLKNSIPENIFFNKKLTSPIGKTTSLSFKLFKKHSFWSANDTQKGIRILGNVREIKYFYNKYYKNEDTRSNNT